MLSLCLVAGLGSCPIFAATHSLADAGPASVEDLMIQKVCADGAGATLPVDPFACHDPNSLRPLAVGEPLPYRRVDQLGTLRRDSYPVLDLYGRRMIVNPADFGPFDRFAEADGYDIYRVRDGWASAQETRDAGGFTTTFFGAGCRPWGGWVFFPATAPIAAGDGQPPIEGRHWQQNGEAWPGPCDPSRLRASLTRWEWLPGFAFGGVHGNPVKKLDTLRSIHGMPGRGHLEVFYFTKIYGLTRWEVWWSEPQIEERPDLQHQVQEVRRRCAGPYRMTYRGVAMVMSACRDWSVVIIAAPAKPPPPWPIPDLNLLHNFSFADGTAAWAISGEGEAPRIANSLLARDSMRIQPGGRGLRYLAIDCSERCPSLSQTVGLPERPAVAALVFAATVRSEKGPANVRLSLFQLDAAGRIVGESEAKAAVTPGNSRFTGAESVLLSSTFVVSPRPVVVDPRARAVRLTIAPLPPGRFDVSDAWVMPSPTG